MSSPLDFEEAREYMAWEPVFKGMNAYLRMMRKVKQLERERVYAQWKRHWRTRLATRLRGWASMLDPPEPSLEHKKPKRYTLKS